MISKFPAQMQNVKMLLVPQSSTHTQLGLDVKPAQLSLARLEPAQIRNELARLGLYF